VLDRHAAPARGFHGLQIEICRAVYLDEHLRECGPGFEAVASLLTSLVRRLASEFGALGGAMRQAAE
jgi:N-formylglutamate amidohydrolase